MRLGQSFKGNPTFVYEYAILWKLEDKKWLFLQFLSQKVYIGPHKYAEHIYFSTFKPKEAQ